MKGERTVFVVGRFPPPVDGQSMATQRLARLLNGPCVVETVNLSPPEEGHLQVKPGFQPRRAFHFLRARKELQSALVHAPQAPVIWASISPSFLGHMRDLLTVRPAFPKPQPVFGVVHRGDFEELWKRLATRTSAKILLKRLQGLVFLNASLAARCTAWVPPHKRFLIPNTVDEEVHCRNAQVEQHRQQRINREQVRLLFLSNMIPAKGYLDVVHAVARLHKQGYNVHADFVGNWTSTRDKDAFVSTIKTLQIAHLVCYHGPVYDRQIIKNLYLQANVFLLPSYMSEAQPLTIIEALNAGTPVITTKQGSIPKMVWENKEGLFVSPRDPEAIADAVQRICAPDRWSIFSINARKRFEEMFSPETVRAQWLDLLAPYLS